MRHRIGLIADIQYGDIDDAWDFHGTSRRKYRRSILSLRNAIQSWLSVSQETERKTDRETDRVTDRDTQIETQLVVDLGDAIEGFRVCSQTQACESVQRLMSEWEVLQTARPLLPVLRLLGNHELYQFTRNELKYGIHIGIGIETDRDTDTCARRENQDTDIEGTSSGVISGFTYCSPANLANRVDRVDSFYYSFLLANDSPWRAIVLDPYDVSVMTKGGGRVNIELTLSNGGLDEESIRLCQEHNPNDILGGGNYFKGVEGTDARWAPFNGALGRHQLLWLENQLRQSYECDEKVIVFSHVILHPNATPDGNCRTLLWNYEQVNDLFHAYPCVRMVFAGHAHEEGYHYCPTSRVHHLSLASPLEAPDDFVEHTFATLEISDDNLHGHLAGCGFVRSFDMEFY